MNFQPDKKNIADSLNDTFYLYLKYGQMCLIAYFILQVVGSFGVDDPLLAQLYYAHGITNAAVISLLLFILIKTRDKRKFYHVNGFVTSILMAIAGLRLAYAMEDAVFANNILVILVAVASSMLNRLWYSVTTILVGGMYFFTVFQLLEAPDHILDANSVYAFFVLSLFLFVSRRTSYIAQFKTRGMLEHNDHALREELEKRKKIEADLSAALQRLDIVMNQIPIGIFWKDIDLRYVGCNVVFARMQGFGSPENVIGKTASELYDDLAAVAHFRESDEEIIATGKPQLNKLEHYRVEGNELIFLPNDSTLHTDSLYYDKNKVPLKNDKDEVIGILGTIENVTPNKILQTREEQSRQQVLRTQKFESLGALSGGIAHEFNNILVGVLGNADFARLKLPDDSIVQKNITGIIESAQRATQLVQQMLLYSGRREIDRGWLNLNDLVEGMWGILSATVPKNIQFIHDLPESLPPCVADGAQLRQVLTNLVMNALESIGDEQGTITVSTGAITRDSDIDTNPLNFVYFEITDTGCGMDPETQRRMFDPFFSTKFAGRGLGMAAVQGIVHAHSGSMTIDSNVNVGSTVRIEIPTKEMTAIKDEKTVELGEKNRLQGTGKILIIDDEAVVLKVSAYMLESMGFEVLTATDGEKGVAVFEQYKDQDLVAVILDRVMPKMSGENVLKEIRKHSKTIPVLICSGHSDDDLGLQFDEDEHALFMKKPFTQSVLEANLAQLIG